MATGANDLGPLAILAGNWEGDKGNDTAPSDDRGTETNLFRERITFEPILPVQNHEQMLYGLRYTLTAWRIGEEAPFHEERGYYLWDPKAKAILRTFTIPRGVCLNAGGPAEPSSRKFQLTANADSPTYGICSNPFLHEEFRTVRFTMLLTVHDDNSFTYEEDTELKIKGQKELFHHRDRNTLRRFR